MLVQYRVEIKKLFVAAGSRNNRASTHVELNGVLPDDRLTPKMAQRAARIAFGHENRVTVYDDKAGYGYIVYLNSARKFYTTIDAIEKTKGV